MEEDDDCFEVTATGDSVTIGGQKRAHPEHVTDEELQEAAILVERDQKQQQTEALRTLQQQQPAPLQQQQATEGQGMASQDPYGCKRQGKGKRAAASAVDTPVC